MIRWAELGINLVVSHSMGNACAWLCGKPLVELAKGLKIQNTSYNTREKDKNAPQQHYGAKPLPKLIS